MLDGLEDDIGVAAGVEEDGGVGAGPEEIAIDFERTDDDGFGTGVWGG
jgi:hypothetical protein